MIHKIVFSAVFSFILIFGAFSVVPMKVEARDFHPLDPLCLFLCDDDDEQVVNNTNTINSNNTNSFNTSNTVSGSGTLNSYTGTVTTPLAPVTVTTPIAPQTGTNYNYNINTNNSGTPVYVPTPVYQQPVYYPQPTPVYYSQPTYYYHTPPFYQAPLSVSCSANTTYTSVGNSVVWSAYVSGYSYGSASYSWSGTDGLYGSQASVSTYYNNPGVKYATVTVYSGGQTRTVHCSNAVTVAAPIAYQQPVYQYPVYNQYPVYASNLYVACAADTTSARIGSPVTWSVEATEGGYSGGFSYSWNGTGGLFGSQPSTVITYSSPGTKTATVTVTSPSGQSVTKTCTNKVYVKSNVTVAKTTPTPSPTPSVTPQVIVVEQPQSAAALFSLNNIPWGWVAVLLILFLIGLVFYLVFNMKKL